jgi:hypothetical protein
VNYDLLPVAPPPGVKVAGDRLFVRGTDTAVDRYLRRRSTATAPSPAST